MSLSRRSFLQAAVVATVAPMGVIEAAAPDLSLFTPYGTLARYKDVQEQIAASVRERVYEMYRSAAGPEFIGYFILLDVNGNPVNGERISDDALSS